jgi:hypothetical protein
MPHDLPGIMRAVRTKRPALSLHRQPALPQSYQPEHAGGLETAITGWATASSIEAVIVPVQDVELGKADSRRSMIVQLSAIWPPVCLLITQAS